MDNVPISNNRNDDAFRKENKMSEEQQKNSSLWMVTFSDLVMLLLTFFVLLLSMSSMDRKKLESLSTHFKEATGLLEFSGYKEISNLKSFLKEYKKSDSLIMVNHSQLLEMVAPSDALDEKLEELMGDTGEAISIEDDERGIVLSFHENIIFDPGQTTIKKEIIPILDNLAKTIDGCSNDIHIMGHTDNVPIRSRLYPSNWELSSYRGLSVLNYFLKEKKLSPSRFSVGGYGSSRPLRPNDTPKNRAFNRRVEIIFRHEQEV